MHTASLAGIHRWVLAVLVLGLGGSFVELVLLAHYEDLWQTLPLGLIALAAAALAWYVAQGSAASRRSVQVVMLLCVASGLIGVILHYQGAAAFQWEMNPSENRWVVFTKAMHAKAPPVLAPGLMAQLGLLGLALTYRTKEK